MLPYLVVTFFPLPDEPPLGGPGVVRGPGLAADGVAHGGILLAADPRSEALGVELDDAAVRDDRLPRPPPSQEQKRRRRRDPVGDGPLLDGVEVEGQARRAARTGDAYDELTAKAARYASEQDWRKAARSLREAIALKPDKAVAYFNLAAMLDNAGHEVEAAQRLLEAKERFPVGSEDWAQATAAAFGMLRLETCDNVAKPEWWNDEGLKALSARVVRAAPNNTGANHMRSVVLSNAARGAWEEGPRSAAELQEAATHYERTAALCTAPAGKLEFSRLAESCRSQAEAM